MSTLHELEINEVIEEAKKRLKHNKVFAVLKNEKSYTKGGRLNRASLIRQTGLTHYEVVKQYQEVLDCVKRLTE